MTVSASFNLAYNEWLAKRFIILKHTIKSVKRRVDEREKGE